MTKSDEKFTFDFDTFDDLLDAIDRIRSGLWRNIDDCKDLETGKLLMQSYLNLLNVQCTIIRNSKVIKILDKENEDED